MSSDRGRAAVAELTSTAEAVSGYAGRVGALAASWRDAARDSGGEGDDVATAIEEAERSLGVAERAVRRAIKLAVRR
jgi:methyl-accepting chemotaxis protein